jgi:hypothetical protein
MYDSIFLFHLLRFEKMCLLYEASVNVMQICLVDVEVESFHLSVDFVEMHGYCEKYCEIF